MITWRPSRSARRAATGFEAHLRIRLALRTTEVAGEHDSRSMIQGVLNGRQRRANALVAGNLLPTGGQRHIEVDANENALAG